MSSWTTSTSVFPLTCRSKKHIIGSTAPTPYLHNLPVEVIERFNKQIVTVVNLLCQPGERNAATPGLDPEMIEKAVWNCYQEEPVAFMDYALYDMGTYPEQAICQKIVASLTQAPPSMEPGKSKMGMGLVLQKLLPKTNSKLCGKPTCLAFAIELAKGKRSIEDCPPLSEPEFEAERQAIM